MKIRKLPQQEKRIETGPTQFGDDWPGLFIRGDNAFSYAQSLRTMINLCDQKGIEFVGIGQLHLSSINCLIQELESADIRKHEELLASKQDQEEKHKQCCGHIEAHCECGPGNNMVE